jgi:collagen type VII alpha
MKAALGITLTAFVAVFAACSSSTTDPAPTGDAGPSSSSGTSGTSGTSGGTSGTSGGTSGTSGTSGGVDAGFDGGFDFTFTGGGTDIKQADFKVAPVYGAFCMGTTPKTCSFTGSVPATGCVYILNVAFIGPLTVGTSFPVVADSSTPPGKGTVNYTESCGATSKMWKGTGGTITLDVVNPPAAGLATGTMTFSVQAATMAAAPTGAGGATGTFSVSGKGANVAYTSPN